MKPEEFPSDSTCTWPSLLATRQRKHTIYTHFSHLRARAGEFSLSGAETQCSTAAFCWIFFEPGSVCDNSCWPVLPCLGPTLPKPSGLVIIFCVYCFQFMYERGLGNGHVLTPLHVTTVCGGEESEEMFWQKELQVQNLRAKTSAALLGSCKFFGRSGFWKASVEVKGKKGARPGKDLDAILGGWNFFPPQANGELLKKFKKAIASLHNLNFVKKEILPQWQCEKWT